MEGSRSRSTLASLIYQQSVDNAGVAVTHALSACFKQTLVKELLVALHPCAEVELNTPQLG